MTTSKKEFMTVEGITTVADILEGIDGCRDASKCMERVSITRALLEKYDVSPHETRVRIDAGHTKFNFKGYRWQADTSKVQKNALIRFDDLITKLKRQRVPAEKIEKMVLDAIPDHSWKFKAMKGTKIIPPTKARQEQVNQRRRERIAAGEKPKHYTLRKRVIGFR
jgi:hypothetical protein